MLIDDDNNDKCYCDRYVNVTYL